MREEEKKSIWAVCGEWLWRARESSAVGVWAGEWQPRVTRVKGTCWSTEQGAYLAMESHLLAEEGSHSGKCFNSQTAHPDFSHGPSVVHSEIYVCPFLVSPSSIRLILVRACSAGLQLWFLKWPSVATSEELCCDWLWAKSMQKPKKTKTACFSFQKPFKLAATISPCLYQIKAPKN